MKKAFPILAAIALLAFYGLNGLQNGGSQSGVAPQDPPAETTSAVDDGILETAYKNRQSDVQVEGAGRVVKVLPDDNEGSRHQKFILELGSGQTILIAHNIDLAPRIPGLREGDSVAFYGEYEWNDKGGVVHWTHHDPQGRHADGWLKHQGKRYQ